MTPVVHLLTVGLVCSYGFWKELRPAVPFLTPFLLSDAKNLTEPDVYSRVYPYWTYSYMVFLVPVFILTDLLRHRPVIVCEALGYVVTWLLLIYAQSVLAMQIMQVVFGFATASEVAYFAFIYTAVPERKYAAVTSYIRAASLLGKCVAYMLGQALMWTRLGDYGLLNDISLATGLLCFVNAIALFFCPTNSRTPEVTGDTSGHRDQAPVTAAADRHGDEADDEEAYRLTTSVVDDKLRMPPRKCTGVLDDLLVYLKTAAVTFRQCSRSAFVVQWCLWWSFSTCGFFQTGNYIQPLWADTQRMRGDTADGIHNGVVEAISALCGSFMAFAVQYAHCDWRKVGEVCLGSMTLLQAVCLIVVSYTTNIWLAYGLYIVYCVCYQTLITIATFNIAKSVDARNHGLIFGFNTFVALILQAVLTMAVADGRGLAFGIRTQFLVYGCYHFAIAAVFLCMSVLTFRKLGAKTCFSSNTPQESKELADVVNGEDTDTPNI